MEEEISVVILKPDAIQRCLVGELIKRIEQRGFKIVGIKMLKLDRKTLKEHYSHLLDKPFYKQLEDFMVSCPVIAIAFKGPRAVEAIRQIVGATDPLKANPGSIRADFSIVPGKNLIHASDSNEKAEEELKRFFKEGEIFDYERDIDKWLKEKNEK